MKGRLFIVQPVGALAPQETKLANKSRNNIRYVQVLKGWVNIHEERMSLGPLLIKTANGDFWVITVSIYIGFIVKQH